jgi:hypothetical protein
LFAALELGEDKLYGHVKPRKTRTRNRIEAQFTALRYFALDGTDHASYTEPA